MIMKVLMCSVCRLELDLDRDQSYKDKRELMAPVYNVSESDQINHFKEVVLHAEMIRVLQVRPELNYEVT